MLVRWCKTDFIAIFRSQQTDNGEKKTEKKWALSVNVNTDTLYRTIVGCGAVDGPISAFLSVS